MTIPLSIEHKLKLSIAMGKRLKLKGHPMKGKHHSVGTKHKISETMKECPPDTIYKRGHETSDIIRKKISDTKRACNWREGTSKIRAIVLLLERPACEQQPC